MLRYNFIHKLQFYFNQAERCVIFKYENCFELFPIFKIIQSYDRPLCLDAQDVYSDAAF